VTKPSPHEVFATSPKSAVTEERNDITIEEVNDALRTVIRGFELKRVMPSGLSDLMQSIRENTEYFSSENIAEIDTKSFSIAGEIAETVKILRSLRRSLFCPLSGNLLEGKDIGEARDLLTTSNSLITTMLKTQEKVINMERFQAMEDATIETLKAIQEDFLDFASAMAEYKESKSSEEGPILKKFLAGMEERLELVGQ
jgi:hypothetical protein